MVTAAEMLFLQETDNIEIRAQPTTHAHTFLPHIPYYTLLPAPLLAKFAMWRETIGAGSAANSLAAVWSNSSSPPFCKAGWCFSWNPNPPIHWDMAESPVGQELGEVDWNRHQLSMIAEWLLHILASDSQERWTHPSQRHRFYRDKS